jgi:hypothetical protein
MRTINLNLSRIPDNREREAINYLTLWSIPSFPVVNIYHDGDRDFVAVYTDPANSGRRYVIGAIWRSDESRYTFHS